jgi:hypothetical protein
VGAESFHEARSKNLVLTKYVECSQYLPKNDDDDDDDDNDKDNNNNNDNNNNLYHIYSRNNKKFSQEG